MKGINPEIMEHLRQSIMEIERELGIDINTLPKGGFSSVKAILEALENPKVCPTCGNRI